MPWLKWRIEIHLSNKNHLFPVFLLDFFERIANSKYRFAYWRASGEPARLLQSGLFKIKSSQHTVHILYFGCQLGYIWSEMPYRMYAPRMAANDKKNRSSMLHTKPFYPQAATCGLSTASCEPFSSQFISALRTECVCNTVPLNSGSGRHRSDRRGSLTSQKRTSDST